MSEYSPSTEPLPLYPRRGLYFAALEGEGILLDLVADRYWGLDAGAAVIWEGLETRAPAARILVRLAERGSAAGVAPGELVPRQLGAWQKAGLVTSLPADEVGVPVSRPAGRPASRSISASELAGVRVGIGALIRLLAAKRWTGRVLADGRLSGALVELATAPVTALPGAAARRRLLVTVKAVRTARKLVMRREDCLPLALCLARALSRQGLAFDLCFGVQKMPFAAHSWVESGGVSLLDPTEDLRRYTVLARFGPTSNSPVTGGVSKGERELRRRSAHEEG